MDCAGRNQFLVQQHFAQFLIGLGCGGLVDGLFQLLFTHRAGIYQNIAQSCARLSRLRRCLQFAFLGRFDSAQEWVELRLGRNHAIGLESLADVADQARHPIQRLEHKIHHRRCQYQLISPRLIQQALRAVSQHGNFIEVEESRNPFHGVKGAEYGVDRLLALRIAFQGKQLGRGMLEMLFRLGDKVDQDGFIRGKLHPPRLRTRLRGTRLRLRRSGGGKFLGGSLLLPGRLFLPLLNRRWLWRSGRRLLRIEQGYQTAEACLRRRRQLTCRRQIFKCPAQPVLDGEQIFQIVGINGLFQIFLCGMADLRHM